MLAEQEARLREAQINSTIVSLKHTINRLLSLLMFKDRNVDTEKLRTRSGRSILKTIVTRDVELTAYNEFRKALVSLEVLNNSSAIYPPLTASDTFKKDVNHKRRAGDSKRCEGTLWTIGEAQKKLAETELGEDLLMGVGVNSDNVKLNTATQFTKRQRKIDILFRRGLKLIFFCLFVFTEPRQNKSTSTAGEKIAKVAPGPYRLST